MSPSKNQTKNKRSKRNNNRQRRRPPGKTQEVGDSSRMPLTTGLSDRAPRYNPTWNPQWLKVARTFQYSAPGPDVAAGFAVQQDLSVGSLATVLSYNSKAMAFRLIDVPQALEFGSLFDQYRIAGVKMDFDYISASQSLLDTSSSTSLQCTMLIYEDFDDSTPPPITNAGWSAVYESGRAIKKVFPNKNNSISYMLKPKFLVAGVDESGSTTGRTLSSGWCDGATTLEMLWRGLKVIVQSNPTTISFVHTFRATATYYIEYRNRQ